VLDLLVLVCPVRLPFGMGSAEVFAKILRSQTSFSTPMNDLPIPHCSHSNTDCWQVAVSDGYHFRAVLVRKIRDCRGLYKMKALCIIQIMIVNCWQIIEPPPRDIRNRLYLLYNSGALFCSPEAMKPCCKSNVRSPQ